MPKVTVEDHGPFRVVLEYGDDYDCDFSHYGEFCELPGRDRDEAQARNDPKGGHFYVRNPAVWRKETMRDGNEWWRRLTHREYGWFRLSEHPRHEVEYLMMEGMPEGEAWQKSLARWPDIVTKLAKGDLSAIWISVNVYFNDKLVGDDSCGGIEVEEFVGEDGAIDLAREYGMIAEAVQEAQKKIEEICKTAMLADRPAGATNAG